MKIAHLLPSFSAFNGIAHVVYMIATEKKSEGNEISIQLLKKYGFEQWAYLPNFINFDGTYRGHIYLGKEIDK